MFKKTVQRGRREREPRGVLRKYVEGSERLRTKLGVFFNILLLAGCVQGENYTKPDLTVPAAWDAMGTGAPHPGVPVSTEKLPEARWWTEFRNDELSRLMDKALAGNHDVRRAASRVMEGRATVMAAGAGLYPQVNLQGQYNHIEISRNTLAGLGLATGQTSSPKTFAAPGKGFDLFNTATDLRWEMDLWGRIRRGMEAATADAAALEQDRRAVELTLIGDLGQSYFRLRELDEQVAIAEKNLALRKDALSIVRSRASVGLASELDVTRAEGLVAESAAQVPDFQRLRAVELHRIEVLTGSPPGTLALEATPLRAVLVQPDIPVGLPSQLLERRPDILQAEQALIAANAKIGEARAFFFPSLSITGQGGVQSVDLHNWFSSNSQTYSIGPSITLPIFLGGTNMARLDAAEARYEQMLESYQQTILNAFREVADQLVSIRSRTEQRDRQREQVRAAETAWELAQVRYREGLVTYLDVLEAERSLLAAETQLVQTERARLTDMVTLFKALGGGWDSAPHAQPTPSPFRPPSASPLLGG